MWQEGHCNKGIETEGGTLAGGCRVRQEMFKRLSEPWVKGESLGFILGS